jgi:hypothetical protein
LTGGYGPVKPPTLSSIALVIGSDPLSMPNDGTARAETA